MDRITKTSSAPLAVLTPGQARLLGIAVPFGTDYVEVQGYRYTRETRERTATQGEN